MTNTKRILYIQPTVFLHIWFGTKPHFCTEPFLRISNYLNSKKSEFNGEIEEEYLDLRIEDLPEYCPENIVYYRRALKKLLSNIYNRFRFDIVAITCYTSYTYLNCIEVSSMIKLINPSSYIVVGGVHPSIYPEDFYPENIPLYFGDYYPKMVSPFDYIIIEEGEITFFNFIKTLLNQTIEHRLNPYEKPIILERNIVEDLDDLPILNLKLFRKYKDVSGFGSEFFIQFNRGCPFRCRFCSPSGNHIKTHRIVRLRSLEKCMADLKVIINTKWLNVKHLHIVDPMFFPKRSIRNKFYEELEKIFHKIDFSINVFDRVETCSIEDLENFKKFRIVPGIGVESVSKKLLVRMGKVAGKNIDQINKGVKAYLDKTITLIKQANKINIPIDIFYLFGVPGTDEETLDERNRFFFEKKFDGKSFIEKYKVNLCIFLYLLLCGNNNYDKGEEMFGAKYYYKQWWKKFDRYQAAYSALISPSKNLSFLQYIESTKDFVRKIYKAQFNLKNPYYNYMMLAWYGKKIPILLKKYEDTLNNLKLESPLSQKILLE